MGGAAYGALPANRVSFIVCGVVSRTYIRYAYIHTYINAYIHTFCDNVMRVFQLAM